MYVYFHQAHIMCVNESRVTCEFIVTAKNAFNLVRAIRCMITLQDICSRNVVCVHAQNVYRAFVLHLKYVRVYSDATRTPHKFVVI